MILFNGIFIFLIFKMLGWPNFGQNFDIFGLKSLKMAVFDVVLSKRHYETSWYFGFSYKIILFNGNFTFWIFKIPGWINFGRFWTFLAKKCIFWPFFAFFVHKLWFLQETVISSDGLSDLKGVSYIFIWFYSYYFYF